MFATMLLRMTMKDDSRSYGGGWNNLLTVSTQILDSTLEKPNYIPIEQFTFTSYEVNYYIAFTIKDDEKLVFETSGELIDMLWFIMIQIIEQTLKNGSGEWTFPSLLRLESVDEQTLKLKTDLNEIVYPKNELVEALLEGFEEFMEFSIPYTLHTRPEIVEEMIAMYRKKVDTIRQTIT